MRHIIPSLVALVILCSVASAHQDTILKLQDGKIIGLPEKYLPASFDVSELSLSLADKRLVLPEVIRGLLIDDTKVDPFADKPSKAIRPCKFSFSASWYHGSMSDLPPYILISIVPEGAACRIELLIDMDNPKFLRADLQIEGMPGVPIDLDGKPDNP
jgi:hypothetical protein